MYLVTAGLVGFTIFGDIYTALLNLYPLRLGYGPEFIGLVNAVGLFGLAIFSPPAGMLGDRWGVRRMMILAYFRIPRGSLPVPASWHLEADKLQYLRRSKLRSQHAPVPNGAARGRASHLENWIH